MMHIMDYPRDYGSTNRFPGYFTLCGKQRHHAADIVHSKNMHRGKDLCPDCQAVLNTQAGGGGVPGCWTFLGLRKEDWASAWSKSELPYVPLLGRKASPEDLVAGVIASLVLGEGSG